MILLFVPLYKQKQQHGQDRFIVFTRIVPSEFSLLCASQKLILIFPVVIILHPFNF